MSHKKAGGTTSLGRDSESKRLGLKLSDGQKTKAGMIIVRQRGTKYHVGANVKKGADDTLYAAKSGFVKISSKRAQDFTGKDRTIKIISVIEG